jgi:hypothetical protein
MARKAQTAAAWNACTSVDYIETVQRCYSCANDPTPSQMLGSQRFTKLTLNDMVHQDQNMLALTFDPIVYAVRSILAALKQISVDSGYADGSARRYGRCKIILLVSDPKHAPSPTIDSTHTIIKVLTHSASV